MAGFLPRGRLSRSGEAVCDGRVSATSRAVSSRHWGTKPCVGAYLWGRVTSRVSCIEMPNTEGGWGHRETEDRERQERETGG